MDDLRNPNCYCRGCRRPGRRTIWQLMRRAPKTQAPETHAQAHLGIEHGRMHDLATLEKAAYGKVVSPELIIHFGYDENGKSSNNGCWANPGIIVTRLA